MYIVHGIWFQFSICPIKRPVIWLPDPACLTGWVGMLRETRLFLPVCLSKLALECLVLEKTDDRRPDITVLVIGMGNAPPETIPDIDLRSRNNFASEV